MTGVKFKKTGKEVKAAIGQRIAELQHRLAKRDKELEEVMSNKKLLRSYLVREPRNEYPHPSQMKAEMPTEEHQRITELCRRIQVIEQEIAALSVVHDNLKDWFTCHEDVEQHAPNLAKASRLHVGRYWRGFGDPVHSGIRQFPDNSRGPILLRIRRTNQKKKSLQFSPAINRLPKLPPLDKRPARSESGLTQQVANKPQLAPALCGEAKLVPTPKTPVSLTG